MPTPPSPVLDRVLDLVRFLRQRCEWDAAQTPETLVPYLLEEANEVADSIGHGSDGQLQGELGDLLLNVAFQLVLAEERGAFTAEDAVRTLEAKMRRRHPHLYGGKREDWELLKARERAEHAAAPAESSVLAGLARGLDPLSRAHRIQERVATVGFDWPSAQGAFEKVAEEMEEVRQALAEEPSPALEEELGDLLFAVVNLARLSGAHAMRALAAANRKFVDRFEQLERLAPARGLVLGEASLEELDALWDEVKRRGPAAGDVA
ncbi:MAG: nucleoside triphosphate pyrophosphohydrolase [Gemmatimonadetes bacterium]|nr:nucleoside triphosphate pyrophosphohydrolase [Gemmatimonadota bacterium]